MELLSGITVPDQTLWLVCFVFFLLDNAKLVDVRQLALIETLRGTWRPALPLYRYPLAGRSATILNPLLPWLAAVRMPWLTDAPFDRRRTRTARRRLAVTAARLHIFRALSVTMFLAIFIVAPVLTSWIGLSSAILTVLPVHIAGIAILAVALTLSRGFLQLDGYRILGLVGECAISPGGFVNVCRKVSWGLPVPGDAGGLVLSTRPRPGDPARHALARYFEELIEAGELRPRDLAAIAAYRAQMAADQPPEPASSS